MPFAPSSDALVTSSFLLLSYRLTPLAKITSNDTSALCGSEARIACRKLLGAPGLPTRSKDPTRGSWPRYERSKDASPVWLPHAAWP